MTNQKVKWNINVIIQYPLYNSTFYLKFVLWWFIIRISKDISGNPFFWSWLWSAKLSNIILSKLRAACSSSSLDIWVDTRTNISFSTFISVSDKSMESLSNFLSIFFSLLFILESTSCGLSRVSGTRVWSDLEDCWQKYLPCFLQYLWDLPSQ